MSQSAQRINIFTDGGSRGNPGEAAYGLLIYDENYKLLYKEGRKIGRATNNVAEYKGVIAALSYVLDNTKTNGLFIFHLDSLLIVNQMIGKYKIKDENLRSLFFTAKSIEEKIKGVVEYKFIRREENREADKLVNLALDKKMPKIQSFR